MQLMQKNFNAGELSPELDARIDLAKYASGAKTMLNGVVHPHGGFTGRPGTVFVAEAKNSALASYLIPFVFSKDQAYIIEIGETTGGDGYARFYMDGWQILTGSPAVPYELVDGVGAVSIPWTADQLEDIRFCQSADILFMTHPDWDDIYMISRTGHTAWSVDPFPVGPQIGRPEDIALAITGSTGTAYRYLVTSVDAETDEESLPSLQEFDITGITQANPGVVSAAGHDFTNGQIVELSGVVGMTEVNGNEYTVANVVAGVSFSIVNTTGFTAYVSGGTVKRIFYASAASALNASNYVTLSWTAVSGAGRYLIYREYAGTYGYLGTTESNTFRDQGLFVPNTEETPPSFRDPFDGTDNVPSIVTFHKERFCGLAPNNGPQKVYFSQAANYYNFNKSFPLRDSDAATYQLLANGQDQVLWAVSLKHLIMGTAAGEWALMADSTVGISPVTPPRLEPQSWWGSEQIAPCVVGNVVLFVRRHGRRLHELVFDYVDDGYKSEDLLVMANHLTAGEDKTLKQLAFAQDPDSILWARRADGVLLGLTYVRAHEVAGWHRHTFSGTVESIAVIPGDGYDQLWQIVNRTIDGSTVRYIERMAPPFISGQKAEEVFCVDSGLTYWAGVDITDISVAVDGTVTVTAAGHGLVDDDTVRISHLPMKEFEEDTDLLGDEINYLFDTVTNVSGDSFDLATEDGSDWAAYVSGGMAGKAITSVSGLDHLEGETVQILADGSPAADQVVASGAITLQEPAARIHVGLGYNVDLETLRPNLEQVEANGQGKAFRMVDAEVRLTKTVGLQIGVDFGNMYDAQFRSPWDPPMRPIEPANMSVRETLGDEYDSEGRLCIRQALPLPISVIGIIPRLEVVE
jgi:hypothetical protein